jgi:hypothetical protein
MPGKFLCVYPAKISAIQVTKKYVGGKLVSCGEEQVRMEGQQHLAYRYIWLNGVALLDDIAENKSFLLGQLHLVK